MKLFFSRPGVIAPLIALVVLLPASALAATLHVVGGELIGASAVRVDGTYYDVSFVDGTCVAVFSGCDEAVDFAFSTDSEASAAAQALFDQVFVDGPDGSFDSDAGLTAGCASTVCRAVIPHSLESGGASARGAWAKNDSAEAFDQILIRSLSTTIDTATEDARVYAVFVEVPPPVPTMSATALGILVLLCVGLGLMAPLVASKGRGAEATQQAEE